MPKIVDHDERRQELAEAAWSIIRREGLEAVSVRKIASEAGVSLGALRHYFNNQPELLSFSMNLVAERVRERVFKKNYKGESLEEILAMIAELMPVDDERRAEGEVWLAFIGRAAYDSAIQALRDQVHKEMYGFFRQAIILLFKCCKLEISLDFELEVKRLHALVDGLVVHNLAHPDMMTVDEMLSIVKHHLNQIVVSERAAQTKR